MPHPNEPYKQQKVVLRIGENTAVDRNLSRGMVGKTTYLSCVVRDKEREE